MIYFGILVSLLFLFFTQRIMGKQLSRLIHRLGGNHNAVIWFWSAIFIPGTLIHEVSHFLAAAATGAHTGNIEVFPEFIDDELKPGESRSVRLGSVQVAKMNPVQGFIVGLAPFITGSALLVWLSTMIAPTYQTGEYLKLALLTYAFFAIANSFFPSWSDLKQALPLMVIVIFGLVIAGYYGLRLSLDPNSKVLLILETLIDSFLISAGVNLFIIVVLGVVNRIFSKKYF